MIDGLFPPPPAPVPGWRWFLCSATREIRDPDGRLLRTEAYSLHVPGADLEEVEAVLAETTFDGVVDGELKGWLPA